MGLVLDSSVLIGAEREARSVSNLLSSHSEDFYGAAPKRSDFIVPQATVPLWLPEDPQIQKVLFFLPAKGGADGGWKLTLVGALDLPLH